MSMPCLTREHPLEVINDARIGDDLVLFEFQAKCLLCNFRCFLRKFQFFLANQELIIVRADTPRKLVFAEI